MTLRSPTDVDATHERWGATCGPAALAAALGVDVEQVRTLVTGGGEGRHKGYMGISDMRIALGRRPTRQRSWSKPEISVLSLVGDPRVVLVQWSGSWDAVPRAAATYRHWIANAVADDVTMIYEVNIDAWIPIDRWQTQIVPVLMPKRCTGWRLSWAGEVHP